MPPKGVKVSCMLLTVPVVKDGGRGKHRRLGNAKPDLFALHATHGLGQARISQCRVPLALRPEAERETDQEDNSHCQEDTASFPSIDSGGQALSQINLYFTALCHGLLTIPHHLPKVRRMRRAEAS